jgi:hypothetical protein
VDRWDHMVFAGVTEVAIGHILGLTPVESGVGAVVAALASWGPDVDQLAGWKTIDRPLPDELLGNGGPMKHRGITHFWLWPVLAGMAAYHADMGDAGWVIWALIWGWTSHLIGDWLFGISPHGIPVLPWWCHWGLGLDSGGRFERWLFLPALTGGVCWWLTGWPGSETVMAWAAAR